MILVISDTHSVYQAINEQIDFAENRLGVEVSSVIHLGDFGVFKSDLRQYFIKENQRFKRPVRFIEGNHEDFNALPWVKTKYKAYLTHLQRGSTQSIDGYRFLALGGADYMDSMMTQRGAEISNADIDHCLTIPKDTIDIVITHDCPIGIGVPNTKGLEYYGQTGFKRSDELVEHFKPKLWLFGHHHKWFQHQDEATRYFGLSSAWLGFGLLDSDYRFEFVKHKITIPQKQSLFDKVLKKMRLTRPLV